MKKRGKDEGAAQRATKRRDSMVRIDLHLPPEVAAMLDELKAVREQSRTAIIIDAIKSLHDDRDHLHESIRKGLK